MADNSGKSRRLFFALWPDAPARVALEALAREVAHESGGRPIPSQLLHLTLAFVGELPMTRLDSLRLVAAAIRARDFVLALDRIGGFQRTGIAWLGSSAQQPELAELHGGLAAALRSSVFPVDDRPYTPHLTLARRSATVVDRRLPQPIRWQAGSFALVASELGPAGPAYRTLEAWPLVCS